MSIELPTGYGSQVWVGECGGLMVVSLGCSDWGLLRNVGGIITRIRVLGNEANNRSIYLLVFAPTYGRVCDDQRDG